ncbi:MAG: transporter substrate-binding domain-containing protein, partial [Bacteroidales bacterium]|nr:transporter substrate-binding domain-containing protein [Bacteroidales bacterium]
MLRSLTGLIVLLLVITSCGSGASKKQHQTKDKLVQNRRSTLDSILFRKKLRAATDYGSVSYLIYRGEPIGYQYELLQNLTSHLGVALELIIVKDIDKSVEMLNNGEIDLIAMGLTVTTNRMRTLEFTTPILTTRQMLVQRKPDGWQQMKTADEIEAYLIRNQIDLAGKTIYVQKGSIYVQRLNTLSDEIADTIYVMEEDKDTEELIAAVAQGEIDFTVTDKYIGLVNTRYYPNIDVKTPISFPQKIAWATKKGQTALTDTINQWFAGFKRTLLSRLLYNKYFENIRARRIAKSQYNSFSGGRLSPYDEEIKKASTIIGWDWRVLASLIYQESEFKPKVRSWVGAYGLMQMMPVTLEKYGLDTTASPDQQITAGARYLKYLDRQLPAEIADSAERMKFVLASYNAGIGHVFDG